MSTTLKNVLLIVGLLIVVIAGSVFYSRSIRRNGEAPVGEAPAAVPEDRTQIYVGKEIHEGVVRGEKAIEEERYEDAVVALEQVPEDDVGYLLALNHLGVARMKIGDWDGARRALERLNELQIDTAEPLSRLSWIYFRLEDHEAAELSALRALELRPDDPALRYDVALFRAAQERLLESLETYERAIAQNAERPYVMRGLEGLVTLHELHPDCASVHYAMAYFAHRLQRDELELEELQHYLAADPNGAAAGFARSRLEELGVAAD